jgi:phage shock protein A
LNNDQKRINHVLEQCSYHKEWSMFKTVLTLFRGSVAAAGEELEGRTALLILDQQMRDSATAVERAKRALALAIAQDQQEGRRLDSIKAQIADLEVRAIAALNGERNDLANEAAEAIATLEADRDAATTARTLFAAEITRLKRQVANAERRITELNQGRRIARAAEAVRALRRGGVEGARPYEATLPEAESTLTRLRERQQELQAADDALADIDAATGPLATAERLAEQGFGSRLRPTADDVLARLKAMRAQDK